MNVLSHLMNVLNAFGIAGAMLPSRSRLERAHGTDTSVRPIMKCGYASTSLSVPTRLCASLSSRRAGLNCHRLIDRAAASNCLENPSAAFWSGP